MNFPAETKLKLYRVLRSLFRYVEFNNNKSALPPLLIELEKDILRDYLLENTKLDTPSSSRHRFGNIYKENGRYFIKLNLQIRM